MDFLSPFNVISMVVSNHCHLNLFFYCFQMSVIGFPVQFHGGQSCTSCPKCRRFDYCKVCQLFTWIFPFKYLVYTLIRYAKKQRFFPWKFNKWFGVLQEYSIINNILLYDIRIGGVDCTRFRFPAWP